MVLIHTEKLRPQNINAELTFRVSFQKALQTLFRFSFNFCVCAQARCLDYFRKKLLHSAHIIVALFKHFYSTLSYCDTILEKIRNGPYGLLWGWGETDS
jgi:hypothetical protein